MNIFLNGKPVKVSAGSSLRDVLKDQPHEKGSLVALARSSDLIKKETSDFELLTSRGPIGLRLNDSSYAALFKELFLQIANKSIRWQTSKVLAVGSFPTDIEVSRDRYQYKKFDCFLATGGFDAKTTYLMVAKNSHEGQYGTSGAVIGKITTGRHVLGQLQEGERLLDIKPLIEELAERTAFVTDDLSAPLEEGMVVESYVSVALERSAPVSCEHFLVVTEHGVLVVTDKTRTFAACSTGMDVVLTKEMTGTRESGTVTVRHEGGGAGRVYFYLERRQVSNAHNIVGRVTQGAELIRLAPAGSRVTLLSEPKRIMVIGLSQQEGQKALEGRGLRQRRAGDTGDDAVIVEQEPELTMEALHEAEIETLGVRPERINLIRLFPEKAPQTHRYFRKMTGLGHKPIGTMKVHFTYPEMPLITFEGDAREGASLIPENEFGEESLRGDIGVTNMSRPIRGLIGIRLDTSDEFGPTGEERYGTNLVGNMVSSLETLMKEIQEGDIIYVRETAEPPPAKKKNKANAIKESTNRKKNIDKGAKRGKTE
ncbi:MAG: methanogenesis marker 3 protein [Methanomassiliicoccales archaeon]|nr:methanogenesis marker 3 protein [Methanomassiliicoccales archaeon]